MRSMLLAGAVLLSACAGSTEAPQPAADPLPSWNEGPVKAAITGFVSAAATEGGPGWIAPADRIAVFDNDGTLWAEQPMYFQALFILDRVRAMAPSHPEWRDRQPFKGILEGDPEAAMGDDKHRALAELVAATHAGMTTAEFDSIVRDWMATARHPQRDVPYTALVYQPMLELLAYLRANGFETWIVSGGGVDFMRAWTEGIYGIPPEQTIGSTGDLAFEMRDDGPVLVKQPTIAHVDDGPGKPVSIHRVIGKRPVMAFGNSDGDLQMLQWTMAGTGPRFAGYLHHTDGEREWAYDRESHVGRLDQGLDEATAKGWTVVDMARDWGRVFEGR